jgi:hypothetical protein
MKYYILFFLYLHICNSWVLPPIKCNFLDFQNKKISTFDDSDNNLDKNENTVFDKYKNFEYNKVFSYIAFSNYNPFKIFSKSFISNFNIKPNSLYINFELSLTQIEEINNNIPNYLTITPISLLNNDKKKNIISINTYNVTSFLFDNKIIPRLEINIYVKNKFTNKIGTLILIYTTNGFSFDPINLLTQKDELFLNIKNNIINCKVNNKNLFFETKINIDNPEASKAITHLWNIDNFKKRNLSKDLIIATDNIYYQNGIIEKMFYNSDFIYTKINELKNIKNIYFKFYFTIPGSNIQLKFNKISSIFMFLDNIYFTTETWSNRNIL